MSNELPTPASFTTQDFPPPPVEELDINFQQLSLSKLKKKDGNRGMNHDRIPRFKKPDVDRITSPEFEMPDLNSISIPGLYNRDEYRCIVEIYDIPKEFSTDDVQKLFQNYQ